jgi:3-oxoacyl-[acyl-carrier-protein] synthase-1
MTKATLKLKPGLPALGLATPLGLGKAANAAALFAGQRASLAPMPNLAGRPFAANGIEAELATLPPEFAPWDSRNNRLLLTALNEIESDVAAAVSRHGAARVAVVLGTSTSGIAEGEIALAYHRAHGRWPEGYHYRAQEPGSPADFVARITGAQGPAYVVATACSSSAKVFASARRLLAMGLCDAAIVGGADTLCGLTGAGFSALGAMAAGPSQPFRAARAGITIGEGAALFLMTREPAELTLLGLGETSDAHHVSAPDPEGGRPRRVGYRLRQPARHGNRAQRRHGEQGRVDAVRPGDAVQLDQGADRPHAGCRRRDRGGVPLADARPGA